MKNSQRRFGAWLRANQKPSIESRLNSEQRFAELKKDYKEFCDAVKQNTATGLDRLVKYQQVVKANEAWRMQPAKEAGLPQQPGQYPVSTYDQDQLWDEVSTPYELRDDARSAPAWDGEPSSATARSSHIYSGLEPLVNLPYTPYELRDDARSAPAWDGEPSSATAQSSHIYSGLESLVDLPSTPYYERDDARSAPASDDWNVSANIRDFGSVVGRWQHGRQPAPDYLSRALIEHGLMPARNSQTRFLIHDQLYTAELRRGGGVFLTQQFGAWLGDRDWLYDPHIERDFDRLRGELQRNHPDLAARTTLVVPAVVQLLQTDPLRAFQYMVRGQPGTAQEGAEDAADFVFIPVTDAQGGDPNQRGTHWSLLLLDRRNRNSPIAYHYDSAGDYNAAAAERVARGVGARVIRMGMAQQQNNYDCGVFLLEAARALIGQLTRGQRPRDLDNLVADRRALQARLRS
ncbi:Ulp1 family isopeptidase (plasmid) [Sinorhizobium meliloti]|nr:Ulp1 family isopeptidase [Sinorhizobium meliloti]